MILSLLLAFAQQPQDLLVIVGDDIGYRDVPPYMLAGDLPNLDQLAHDSLRFERAYAEPVCSPSRYALLFGRWPRREDLGNIVNTYASASTPSPYPSCLGISLAEALKPTHSTALVGKYHLGRAGGLKGNLFDVESSAFVNGFDHAYLNPDSIGFGPSGGGPYGYYNWHRINDGASSIATLYATDAECDELVRWWNATPAPRFAVLALSAAHASGLPERYEAPPGEPLAPTMRERFEAIWRYADGRLGQVLTQADLANAYVVFCGDNGTPDEARPIVKGQPTPSGYWKGTTFEGGIKVPLWIRGRWVSPGTTQRLVSLIDLPATLLETLSLPRGRGFEDSVSFADEFCPAQGAPPRTWTFAERYDTEAGGVQPAGYDDQAVIEASWKLRVVDPDGPGPLPAVESVYYLPGDPYELQPLPPSTPGLGVISNRLHAELASLPPRP